LAVPCYTLRLFSLKCTWPMCLSHPVARPGSWPLGPFLDQDMKSFFFVQICGGGLSPSSVELFSKIFITRVLNKWIYFSVRFYSREQKCANGMQIRCSLDNPKVYHLMQVCNQLGAVTTLVSYPYAQPKFWHQMASVWKQTGGVDNWTLELGPTNFSNNQNGR